MVVFMYGEDYDDNTKERRWGSIFDFENTEVGIADQDKG